MASSSRAIVYRKLRAATDPKERNRLVLDFTAGELRFLLDQIEAGAADELTPENVAKALRDVASVLVLPPSTETIRALETDPADSSAA